MAAKCYGPTIACRAAPARQLHDGLAIDHAILIMRKGYNREVDSYSAFMEADRRTPTGLAGFLKEKGVRRVFVCGLATDFCVGWSALDARAAGFDDIRDRRRLPRHRRRRLARCGLGEDAGGGGRPYAICWKYCG